MFFNHDGQVGLAITVGGQGAKASCGTFITLDARGGLPTNNGQVGACQRLGMRAQPDRMCTAEAIDVAGAAAECLNYQVC